MMRMQIVILSSIDETANMRSKSIAFDSDEYPVANDVKWFTLNPVVRKELFSTWME